MHIGYTKIALALTAAMVSGACGGGGGGGDSTGPGTTGEFRFTAKVDGAQWASTAGAERIGVQLVLPGVYSMTGVQLGGATYTIALSLYNIGGTGTYPLGVGPTVAGGSAIISNATGGWATPQSGAAGTITITTLSASRIEGTFNFTADPISGSAAGTKTVSDGSFVLEVKPQGTIGALPENAGSKLSTTLNGAAFNAAAVSGIYSGTGSGILSIAGSTNTRSVSITLTDVTAGPGTYTLGSGRTLGVNILNGAQLTGAYISSAAGGSGSVTITSFTATRIKGTFTATLGPALGTATTGTMTVANGTFDVGRR